MDKDLLSLLKETYARFPKWSDTEWVVGIDPMTGHQARVAGPLEAGDTCPLYTVDYILRKLQAIGKTVSLDYHSSKQILATASKEWTDKYTASTADMTQGEYPYSDTALRALLQLVIILDNKQEIER